MPHLSERNPRHAVGVYPSTEKPANARRSFAIGLLSSLLFASIACLVGCVGSMESLDQDVAKLIERRQKLALGQHDVNPAQAGLPRYPDASAALYDETPETFNPAAAELDTTPADQDKLYNNPDSPGGTDPYAVDPAGDFTSLDLPALLAYSIENAPEYRSEKEVLFLATLSLIIERHEWGPRFFSTVATNVSGTPESGDFDTALNLVNDFTVTQRLPYGGAASVSALVNYTNLLQQASTSTAPDETQSSAVVASINLPLLRGAGMVAREGLIQAERDLIYAARDFERFRREFFVDISITYFGLLQQQNRIENRIRQIEGLERLAREQRRLFETGRIPEFEATDAEAQVLFGQSDLAAAQDQYASALDALKLRIGMPVSTPLVITPAQITVPQPALDPLQSITIGQTARLDLQNTADRVTDAKRATKIARDQLRGDLDLNASLALNSDSTTDVDGVDLELSDSDYQFGVAYSLPLDRRIELAQYRRSLVNLERVDRSFRIERDRVGLQIRDASRDIARANLTLELQIRNVQLAERRLQNVQIRRRRGEVPPRRVIEAEQDLLDARNSRDQSRTDLQNSVLNYLLQTGQMRVARDGSWQVPGAILIPADPADVPDTVEDAPAPIDPAPADPTD